MEHQHCRKTGFLAPEATQMMWKMIDPCGTTEGRMMRHPDRNIRMTICKREYHHYKKYGVLLPVALSTWQFAAERSHITEIMVD